MITADALCCGPGVSPMLHTWGLLRTKWPKHRVNGRPRSLKAEPTDDQTSFSPSGGARYSVPTWTFAEHGAVYDR